MARYTEGQEILRKLQAKGKRWTQEEEAVFERALLPRTVFLPDSEDECRALASAWLGEELTACMDRFLHELERVYGALDVHWVRGGMRRAMYLSVHSGGKPLCRLAVDYRILDLVIAFGAAECARFERARNAFPAEVRWAFDFFPVERGVRTVRLDLAQEEMMPWIWQLLAVKRPPLIVQVQKRAKPRGIHRR